MSQPLDVVYVEVRSRGERDAANDVRAAVLDIEKAVKEASKDIEDSFEDVAKSIEDSFTDISRDVRTSADDMSTSFTDAADRSAAGFDALTAAAEKTRQDMARIFEEAGFELVSDFDTATGNLKQSWVRIGDDAEDASERVQAAIRALEDDGFQLSRSVDAATGEVTRSWTRVGDDVEEVSDRVSDSLRDSETAFDRFRRRTSGIFGGVTEDSDSLSRSFRDRLRGAIDSVTESTREMVGRFQDFASSGPVGLGLTLAAVATLTPAVVALGAALLEASSVVALLPGLIGGVAAAGGTLILAFQGVGEAIEALGTGDLEDIEEAFEGLAPAAAAFAREVDRLREPFAALQRAVQQAFFAELTGELTRLARTALPVLRTGLTGIASALGEAGAEFLRFLGQASTLQTLSALFTSVRTAVETLTPSVLGLFDAIVGSTDTALPFIDRMVNMVARLVDEFAEFISTATESGDLESFLEGAFATFGELEELLRAVGNLVVTIFGGASDEGRTLLQTLTDIVNELNAFLSSAEGQQNIQDLLDAVLLLAGALVSVTGFLTDAATEFRQLINRAGEAKESIGEFFTQVGETASSATDSVRGFFTQVGEFFTSVGESATSAFDTVRGFFDSVVAAFQALPGRVVAVLQALPGQLAAVFVSAFDAVTFAIGFGIGTVLRFFIDLPGQIQAALASLVGFVSSVFTATLTAARELASQIVTSTVNFFAQLPDRARSAINGLVSAVTGVFNSARTAAVDTANSIVSRVAGILRELPGRAASALSSFASRVVGALRAAVSGAVGVGSDIMAGVVRGITAGISGAVNAATRAARNILRGMQDALDIGSPSRVFAEQVGEPITQGIAVGVNAGTPDLLRVLNALSDSLVPGTSNVSQSGDAVTFGPGAIQITVMGAAGAGEARALGSTVGAGVVDALTRRRVQLRVRTI